jgi:hypothetical protein
MEVSITLAVEDPPVPVRMYDHIPVYAMGQDLVLAVTFTNDGGRAVSMDDPQVSQALYLLLARDGSEDALYMVHPSTMDATGELTGPVPATLELPAGGSVAVSFRLHQIVPDRCFSPGTHSVYIEFHGVRSAVLEFGVEFRAESVPTLAGLATDETADPWLRREAVDWLGRLPEPPGIRLPESEESDAERRQRIDENTVSVNRFLGDWQLARNRSETRAVFERLRLRETE